MHSYNVKRFRWNTVVQAVASARYKIACHLTTFSVVFVSVAYVRFDSRTFFLVGKYLKNFRGQKLRAV